MSEVDFDRLADFLGGALDGTPDADQIRDQVATDPEWTAAYHDLLAANDSVARALRGYAQREEPMPSEVTTRLHAALTSELPPNPATPPTRPDAARPSRRAGFASGTRRPRPPDNRPQPRRAASRHGQRWLAVLATITVLAVSGIVTSSLLARKDDGSPSLTRGNAAASPSRDGEGAGKVPVQVASGRDYDPGTLSAVPVAASVGASAAVSVGADSASQARSAAGVESSTGRTLAGPEAASAASVPVELSRLSDQRALLACLATVVVTHPGTVSLVDYARFQGRPALLVVLNETSSATGRTVVVVGPDCGLRGGQSDERYTAKS